MPTNDESFIQALNASVEAYRSKGFRTPVDKAIPRITDALLREFRAGRQDVEQLTKTGLVVVDQWSDDVPAAQYIVLERDGRWWFTLDGSRHGPFEVEADAVDAAISHARFEKRSGRSAEVSVARDGNDTVTVFSTEA